MKEMLEAAKAVKPRIAGLTAGEKNAALNDVTVKAIPDYEVTNEAGGNTFIIGKEII